MSDSDSDGVYHDTSQDVEDHMASKFGSSRWKNSHFVFSPSEEAVERWSAISYKTRREALQRMKVLAFWLPILLRRDESSVSYRWASKVGLVGPSKELSLNHIRKIEIVEEIFRTLEIGTLRGDQSKHIIFISTLFVLQLQHIPELLVDAMRWFERTGGPSVCFRILQLGHERTCFIALQFIFTEFARHVQEMGSNLEMTMRELMAESPNYDIQKSEEMKKKGNHHFQEQDYEQAIRFYSKAIGFNPENHIFYGNRALCYIRCEKYLKAVCDGKRAILIKPLWAKGHYRYCEALFSMKEVKMAFEANSIAVLLCSDDPEGLQDLSQQRQKFINEVTKPTVSVPKKSKKKRSSPEASESRPQSVKAVNDINSEENPAPKTKVAQNKTDKKTGKNEKQTPAEGSTKDAKPSISEVSAQEKQKETPVESNNDTKKKRNNPKKTDNKKQKLDDGKASLCKELSCLVQDAHTALTDLRGRDAEQAFSRALALLETNTPDDLGLSSLDVMLLLYGRVSALTEIGQPEELAEAQKVLEKIKTFEERTFECLVVYGVGRIFLTENRFSVALEQFLDSLQMVKNKITPGKLTWPLTKAIVKETQPEYFKEVLESSIDLCKFPPPPDAMCRLDKCHGHRKAEIYITDPDFKGFIQIRCCQSCVIEYHTMCWKTLKTSTLSDKNDKEFLKDSCLTPDCEGKICGIKIFGPTGLVKCKFEVTITKPQTAKKPKVNQKCTSQKKLKSKEEQRLKRKQHKQTFQRQQPTNGEIPLQKEDSASQSQQKAWQLYRDQVLLQLSQHMELLREEKSLRVSTLTDCLRPWLMLDSQKGNPLAERLLNCEKEQLETTPQVAEAVLERKNRVWARVVVQQLGKCQDINPKLYKWAHQLNDAGLNAAKRFVELHSEHLEQLDLSTVLTFSPLQEVILEKLGAMPDLFSSVGVTMTDYLKQAPPDDVRLFIWALEEHRDEFVSCHSMLDDFFDMMDGLCSVLKKSDESENNSHMKGRGRKKKHKEAKLPHSVFGLSNMGNLTSREDLDFYEDHSLSFLNPDEPFSVPSQLREQVAEFESQYSGQRGFSHNELVLDNSPDPTKKTLYDYFAQILEQHGPLGTEHHLLVGELNHFPPEARLKIQEAGGIEAFLLGSLRFIKMGRSIGLAKHAVSMQHGGGAASLANLDVFVDPDSPPALHSTAYTSFDHSHLPASAHAHLVLPNPYIFSSNGAPPQISSAVGVHVTGEKEEDRCVSDLSQVDDLNGLPDYDDELDLYSAKSDERVSESGRSSGRSQASSADREESFCRKQAATEKDNVRSVAVNTELYERFEIGPGDINEKQKSNEKMEKLIEKMSTNCDDTDTKQNKTLAALQEDIQKINGNIQVTNQELSLLRTKLEEEVRMDQKEKKANQEVLKSIKLEMEEIAEDHERLSQTVREKKSEYDLKLSEFLELSNQSAAEKLNMEDEIKRCRTLLASAHKRSQKAQLSLVECSRDRALHSLCRELANTKALLNKLDEEAHRFPSQQLEATRCSVRADVQNIERKISTRESQHRQLMEQVKNGTRVSELPSVDIDDQPEAPPAPPPESGPVTLPIPQAAAAPSRSTPPPPSTVFDKAMEQLTSMFPDYSRAELKRFIQEFRSSNGGSLNSMLAKDLVAGVTNLILNQQEKNSAPTSTVARGAQAATPPPVVSAWQTPKPPKAPASNALNAEDPCIICHEDMSPESICVLECRHSFHDWCIRSWLKEKNTCPTCRDTTLLPDFPLLTSRRRQVP